MGANKKTPLSKILTIIGALAGLLAAATPGAVEYLDKSEESVYEKVRL